MLDFHSIINMYTNTLYDRIVIVIEGGGGLMIFIQNGVILGNSNAYTFLDINRVITRGLHTPGSRGGRSGDFQNTHSRKQPYKILGIIRGCSVCVFQNSSLANNYIVGYIIPTEYYIAFLYPITR